MYAPQFNLETVHGVIASKSDRLAQMRDQAPSPQAAVAEFRDMLEALQACYEELRVQCEQLKDMQVDIESERQRYRELLDLMPDAYLVTTGRGVISEANAAAARLLGVPRDQLCHAGFFKHIRRDRRWAFERQLMRLHEEDHLDGWETELQLANGTTLPVELKVWVVRDHDSRHLAQLRWLVCDISCRRALEREVVNISTEERRRLGADLHDSLSSLLGVALGLTSLRASLQGEQAERIAALTSALGESMTEIRRISHGLCLAQQVGNDLFAPLESLACRTGAIPDVECTLECRRPCVIQSTDTNGHLVRIAQEAVNNAVKHGRAKHIHLIVDCKPGQLTLTIRDDGVGMNPQTACGMGLHLMKYRADLMNGHLELVPSDHGTTIRCTIPQPN